MEASDQPANQGDVVGLSRAALGVMGAAGSPLASWTVSPAFSLLQHPLWGPALCWCDVKWFSAFSGMPGQAVHGWLQMVLWKVLCPPRKPLYRWKCYGS